MSHEFRTPISSIGTAFNLKYLIYICSHETEITQWDHPEMVTLMEEIGKFFGFFIFILKKKYYC